MAFPFSLDACFLARLTAKAAIRTACIADSPRSLAKAPLEKMTFKVY
jgi:hypothetical protein